MDDLLSTKQVGWVLGRSASSIRDGVKTGEIAGTRIPAGFRIPKAEVFRLAREKLEGETGRKVSDKALEQLIDEVIATNEAATT
jgi:hypothetical protein